MFQLFRWLRDWLLRATNLSDSTAKAENWEQSAVLTQPYFHSNTGPPRLIMVHSNQKSEPVEKNEEHRKPSFSRNAPIQCVDPKRTAYFTPGNYAPPAPRRRGDDFNLLRQQMPKRLMRARSFLPAYGTFGRRPPHRVGEQE